MNFLKNTGIIILNVIFSIVVFAAAFIWFVSMDILEKGTEEFKLVTAGGVFVFIQILYTVIRVKLKKYKRFEIVYSCTMILVALFMITLYTIKNYENVVENIGAINNDINYEGIEEDNFYTIDTEIYFDKNMKKIKKVNNEYRYVVEYSYDTEGKIVAEKQSRKSGEPVSEIKYIYNKNLLQKKIEDSGMGEYEERYSYDEKNNLIKMEKYNFEISREQPVIYEEYIFDEKGRKIAEKRVQLQ